MPSRRTTIWIFLSLTCFCAIGAAGYFGYQYYQLLHKDPNQGLDQALDQLRKHVELPEGIPTFATVTDVSKLQNQPLFAHSQNGDQVLIYPDAGRAYLYRPSTRKLIDIGPVQARAADQEGASLEAQPSAKATP